jgi:mono/diheme cytochrome c family protein
MIDFSFRRQLAIAIREMSGRCVGRMRDPPCNAARTASIVLDMKVMGWLCLLALVMGTLLSALPHRAAAQEIGDIAAGRRLAETWCSSCHLIGPDAANATSNGVPPFAAIGRMKSTTVLSLRAFLQTPHARMPDLHLTRDEVDDLAGYILSLRGQSQPSG